MRLAGPGIQLMLAVYSYPLEALAPMLDIVGRDIDFVIYRQSDPDFVKQALQVIRAYNDKSGTGLGLANT